MVTLYDYWRSSAAYRVRIALNLKNIPYAAKSVHLVRHGGEQKTPAYRALNPQGLVPTLVLDGGEVLTQSLAIIEYLDETVPEPPLLGSDLLGRAQVRALAQIVAADIHPLNNLRALRYLKAPLGHAQPEIDSWVRNWIAEGFAALEAHAAKHQERFSCGDRPSLADICLVPQMYNARRFASDLTPYPRLVEIDAACRELPAFAAAAPEAQADAQP